jgi:hypothetical protein
MIFSNVSSSFVKALLRKELKDVAFVYQLKGRDFKSGLRSVVPEAVVSVCLEVEEKSLPMVKLNVVAQKCKSLLGVVWLNDR